MKPKIALLVSCIFPLLKLTANEFDPVILRGQTDHPNPVDYKINEPITITFTFDKCCPQLTNGTYQLAWFRQGDDLVETSGNLPLDGHTPLSLTTKLDRPGFIYICATVKDAQNRPVLRETFAEGAPQWEKGGREIRFDGGAGVEINCIRPLSSEPSDFDAFWARQLRRLADVPLRAHRQALPAPQPGYCAWAVTIDCAGPRPATGLLVMPENAAPKSLRAELNLWGYGAGNILQRLEPRHCQPNRVFLLLNAHGHTIEKGNDPDYVKAYQDGVRTPSWSYAFSPYQNEFPEGCYFNGMALRAVRACSFLKSLPEWNERDLRVSGDSQGGLQTLWVAALVDGISEAALSVPWCCDLQAQGQRLSPTWHIPFAAGLAYYDPVFFARRVKGPVTITRAGLGDMTCVPSGIAALYNELPENQRTITWVQGSRHGFIPPEPNQSITLPIGCKPKASKTDLIFTDRHLPQ